MYAQDSAGIGLTPATIERAADPGALVETQLEVTNLSDVEQTYYLFVRDIIGVRDGNAPEFADGSREKTGFEISEWVELPPEPYVVAPGDTIDVPLVVRIPDDATPGSHFGGVFVSVEPPKLRTIGAGVGYEVASILSIKVSGEAVVNAQIREFSTEKIIHGSTDVRFNVRLQNTGTVLVRPQGPLEVFNMFGKSVHVVNFNETQGGVFPGTIRDFALGWSDDSPGFGRYQAVLALVYEAEGGNRTIDDTVSFWILPMKVIGPAIAALIIFFVVVYVSVRVYVRRTVQSATSGRRHLVRSRRKSRQISMLTLISIVLLTVTALFLILILLLFA